jgi:hypothetical protein
MICSDHLRHVRFKSGKGNGEHRQRCIESKAIIHRSYHRPLNTMEVFTRRYTITPIHT